jgi:hypothetical protein
MENSKTQQRKSPIAQLSPAARALLLAYYYGQFGDKIDDYVQRAGIRDYATYQRARQQLQALGFLNFAEGVMPVRYEQKPERITSPYTATVNTKIR